MDGGRAGMGGVLAVGEKGGCLRAHRHADLLLECHWHCAHDRHVTNQLHELDLFFLFAAFLFGSAPRSPGRLKQAPCKALSLNL